MAEPKVINVFGCNDCPAGYDIISNLVHCGLGAGTGSMICEGVIVRKDKKTGVAYEAHLFVLPECPLRQGPVTLKADWLI